MASCGRKRISLLHVIRNQHLIVRSIFGKNFDNCLHKFFFRSFTAIAERVNDACFSEKLYASGSKIFRGSGRPYSRKFEYQIGTAEKCHAGARVFVGNGRNTALHKISAHGNDHKICSCKVAYGFHLILVSVVKRIVFDDNSCCFHVCLLFGRFFCLFFC